MKNAINLKSIAILAVVLMCATPLFSQGGRGQGQGQGQRPQGGQGRQMTEENVKERVDQLQKNLELTDEQTTKLKDFEVELFKKNQVERQKMQAGGDREAMREYMMKQRETRDKKYEEVLTEEQLKKYKESQDKRRQDMEKRRQQRPADGDGDRPARGRGRG